MELTEILLGLILFSILIHLYHFDGESDKIREELEEIHKQLKNLNIQM